MICSFQLIGFVYSFFFHHCKKKTEHSKQTVKTMREHYWQISFKLFNSIVITFCFYSSKFIFNSKLCMHLMRHIFEEVVVSQWSSFQFVLYEVQFFLSCLAKVDMLTYRKIPKISPSKYKPPNLVTQKTFRFPGACTCTWKLPSNTK